MLSKVDADPAQLPPAIRGRRRATAASPSAAVTDAPAAPTSVVDAAPEANSSAGNSDVEALPAAAATAHENSDASAAAVVGVGFPAVGRVLLGVVAVRSAAEAMAAGAQPVVDFGRRGRKRV
jgi:hypothetical protein